MVRYFKLKQILKMCDLFKKNGITFNVRIKKQHYLQDSCTITVSFFVNLIQLDL